MAAPATVPAIGAGHGIEFRAHKMFAARASMATPAENPDLIYKI
jgi:hypothetical protein